MPEQSQSTLKDVRLVITNHYYRLSHLLAVKLSGFRSPFLFAADLFAELYVLALCAGKLLLKAENFFLNVEKSRAKRKNLLKSV